MINLCVFAVYLQTHLSSSNVQVKMNNITGQGSSLSKVGRRGVQCRFLLNMHNIYVIIWVTSEGLDSHKDLFVNIMFHGTLVRPIISTIKRIMLQGIFYIENCVFFIAETESFQTLKKIYIAGLSSLYLYTYLIYLMFIHVSIFSEQLKRG